MDDAERKTYQDQIDELKQNLDKAMDQLEEAVTLLKEIRDMAS